MFKFLRTSGFRCGLIGAAVVLVGGKLVKTKAAHKAAVNVAAWGMQAKNDIAESLRNIRDVGSFAQRLHNGYMREKYAAIAAG